MIKIPHRIQRSLTAKVVIALGLLISFGSIIFLYTNIRAANRALMENTLAFVSSLSEVTKRSIRHDMLAFHRDDIQKTIESIGASELIERIRIFNEKGLIVHSSDRSEIGRNVDRSSPACIGCHTDPLRPHETLVRKRQWTIFRAPEGQRTLSFIEPIYNDPDCFNALCHAHSRDVRVLGILESDFSLISIDSKLREQMAETAVYVLSFLAVSVALLYLVLWRFVLRPVTALSEGMKQVSSGDLLQKVPVPSEDEIGRLGRTFNKMTDELNQARHRMERWTQSLEEEVEKKTNEIKKTQGKLIQAEKLAALGRFTSDIAHEIRNPLTALGGFGRRLQKLSSDERAREYADIVVSEVDRLENILRDVMTFSREARFHFELEPLHDTVMKSVAVFQGLCEEQSIKVEVITDSNRAVLLDRGQAMQAVKNLISNAIDAMPGGGTLTIHITEEHLNDITFVVIRVSDTGEGIPEDELHLIFEPFHTTKEIGHGTGLGLSISRKIMEEHGGFVKAGGRPERGTTVSLYFPYQSREDMARTPCWEFMKCGRDTDKELKCPAYPHFGRVCWVVAGTFCEGKVQGTFAQKCEDCRKCMFHSKVVSKAI